MITLFISCVTDEFGGYRRRLLSDLGTTKVTCLIQELMPQSRYDTVRKLDSDIRNCTMVIHLLGRGAGAPANGAALSELFGAPGFDKFDEFAQKHFGAALAANDMISYTQWEVILAKFRDKPVFVFEASSVIADGHPADKGPFAPKVEDDASVTAHKARLSNIRRYSTQFDSYESLRTAVFRTVLDDLAGELRVRTETQLASLAEAEEVEARRSRQGQDRFGPLLVHELKAVLAAHPKLGGSGFLTVALACLNNGLVSWVLPEALGEAHVIAKLIDRAVTDRSVVIFPSLILILFQRAKALADLVAAEQLDRLLAAVIGECGVSREALDGACAPAAALDYAASPQGVLQIKYAADRVTRVPAAQRAAVYRIPGAGPMEVTVRGEGGLEDVVERARQGLAQRPQLVTVPTGHVEVFAAPEDVNANWECKRNGMLHHVPVAVRLSREVTDWDDMVDPPPRLRRDFWPCRRTAADDIRAAARARGLFFAAGEDPDCCRPEAIRALAESAALGVWVRVPAAAPAVDALLDDLDEVDVVDLPHRVHKHRRAPAASLWPHVVLHFGQRQTEFPRLVNRQKRLGL